MPQRNSLIGVLGRKGCGKSSLVKSLLSASQKRVIAFDYIGEYGGVIVRDYRSLVFALKTRKDSLSVRIMSAGENAQAFTLVSRLSSLCIGLDECDMFASPSSVPDGLAALARYGRHRNLDLIFASRRPADVPRILTSQADILYCFQIREPRDLLYLRQFSKLADTLPSLPEFKYVRLI